MGHSADKFVKVYHLEEARYHQLLFADINIPLDGSVPLDAEEVPLLAVMQDLLPLLFLNLSSLL